MRNNLKAWIEEHNVVSVREAMVPILNSLKGKSPEKKIVPSICSVYKPNISWSANQVWEEITKNFDQSKIVYVTKQFKKRISITTNCTSVYFLSKDSTHPILAIHVPNTGTSFTTCILELLKPTTELDYRRLSLQYPFKVQS